MERRNVTVLIVDDNDLDCRKDKKEITLDDIKLSSVGFVSSDLEKYSLIIYKGALGKKVLKVKV